MRHAAGSFAILLATTTALADTPRSPPVQAAGDPSALSDRTALLAPIQVDSLTLTPIVATGATDADRRSAAGARRGDGRQAGQDPGDLRRQRQQPDLRQPGPAPGVPARRRGHHRRQAGPHHRPQHRDPGEHHAGGAGVLRRARPVDGRDQGVRQRPGARPRPAARPGQLRRPAGRVERGRRQERGAQDHQRVGHLPQGRAAAVRRHAGGDGEAGRRRAGEDPGGGPQPDGRLRGRAQRRGRDRRPVRLAGAVQEAGDQARAVVPDRGGRPARPSGTSSRRPRPT